MTSFHLIQSGFHALERLVAAESWEILGALGVAADPYPHQLENVRRILSATEIRHLLADEVGMGKTVQALMVLNVLRRRDPSLRVAIVAPERICYQWQAELSARGHVSATIVSDEAEDEERPEGEGYVHLIKADMIRRQPARPSPGLYDMLIVDEVHALSLADVTFLSSLCRERRDEPRFRHVLLLTATPRLGHPEWARAVLGMIEPERTEIAGLLDKEPLAFLAEDAAAGKERVASGEISDGVFADALAADRRILRQTRAQWPGVAPVRKVHTVRTLPSDAELARIALQNAACRAGSGGQLDAAPWLQWRQLFRSRDSIRDVLKNRAFAPHADLRDEAETVLSRNPGIALFEDLCDILLKFWSENPERPVIVVAGDTPTVDMLERRLLQAFPHLAGGAIATMRGRRNTDLFQVVGAVESHATVLIMEEFVEAGLNLHNFALDMIFYNLPWQAVRIDQLIGRLDRLRADGLRKALRGKGIGTIGIWRMVMAGSADERVLDALDLLDVFERPMPYLDEELTARVDAIVADAAAGRAGFRAAAEALKAELLHGLSVVEPAPEHDAKGEMREAAELVVRIRNSEKKAEAWLELFWANKTFQGGRPKTIDGERVATLSLPREVERCPYQLGVMTIREQQILRLFRHKLGKPPKKDVMLPGDQVGKPARFFSTGDALHDDLLGQALEKALAEPFPQRPVGIMFPADHPASDLVGSDLLIVRVGWRPSRTLAAGMGRAASSSPASGEAQRGGAQTGASADARLLSWLFPDALETVGWMKRGEGAPEALPDDMMQAVLSASAQQTGNERQQKMIPPWRDARQILTNANPELVAREHRRRERLADNARESISERIQDLRAETETYERWRQLVISRLEAANITSPSQRQMHEGQIAAERRRIEARREATSARVQALETGVGLLAELAEPDVLRLVVRVIPAANTA
jgi:hypothetical protein